VNDISLETHQVSLQIIENTSGHFGHHGTEIADWLCMVRHVSPWKALRNGLHQACPHCGHGRVVDGWLTARDRCPECGLVYERTAGDTWAFWIIGDRIPVAVGIAACYFGIRPHSLLEAAWFLGVLAVPLIATMPQRVGLVVALHYLSRCYWPDPDDPIPASVPPTL
jgi:uncharacterized protein (DUF983 family)